MSNPVPPEGDRPTYIDPATGQPLYIDPTTGQLAYNDPIAAPVPLQPSGPPNYPGFPPAGYPPTPYQATPYPPTTAETPDYGQPMTIGAGPAYPQSYPGNIDYGAGAYPYAAYPYPAMPMQQRNNSLALASMIISIVSVVLLLCDGIGALLGLTAAILGHVGRRQIAQRGEGGAGMALTGIIIGWITFGIGMAGLVVFVIYLASSGN